MDRLIILLTLLTLTACGGGGGGSDSDNTSSSSNNSSDNCSSAVTGDRYAASSYSNCDVDDSSLVGQWIVISDYQTTANVGTEAEPSIQEKDHQQRMVIAIKEDGDQLMASICNFDTEMREYSFATTDSQLTFYEEYSNTNIRLDIISNVLMEGSLQSNETVTVNSSTVTAKKIHNNPNRVVGGLNLEFDLGGLSHSENSLGLSCFTQERGTTNFVTSGTSYTDESIAFFKNVTHNGLDDEITFDLYDDSEGDYFYIDFIELGDYIESYDDSTVVNYSSNTASSITLTVSGTDIDLSDYSTSLSVDIDL